MTITLHSAEHCKLLLTLPSEPSSEVHSLSTSIVTITLSFVRTPRQSVCMVYYYHRNNNSGV